MKHELVMILKGTDPRIVDIGGSTSDVLCSVKESLGKLQIK